MCLMTTADATGRPMLAAKALRSEWLHRGVGAALLQFYDDQPAGNFAEQRGNSEFRSTANAPKVC